MSCDGRHANALRNVVARARAGAEAIRQVKEPDKSREDPTLNIAMGNLSDEYEDTKRQLEACADCARAWAKENAQ
jgi:hypothetical protein